ncbi:uncharacterized protein LOC110851832 isoform X1 [Folsomia candida]|uniref:uncharacterized protein LOC110851832 isoform X1 n=2 Tax=Folsomia candida TaxID=158441 RepID=UPI000B9073AE|nr:uncharacterized protein LOC110851832 isoform X1 [Folsomia candida]
MDKNIVNQLRRSIFNAIEILSQQSCTVDRKSVVRCVLNSKIGDRVSLLTIEDEMENLVRCGNLVKIPQDDSSVTYQHPQTFETDQVTANNPPVKVKGISKRPAPDLIDLTSDTDDEGEVDVQPSISSSKIVTQLDGQSDCEWNTKRIADSSPPTISGNITNVNDGAASSDDEATNIANLLKQDEDEIISMESDNDNENEDKNHHGSSQTHHDPSVYEGIRTKNEELVLVSPEIEKSLHSDDRSTPPPPLLVMDAFEPFPNQINPSIGEHQQMPIIHSMMDKLVPDPVVRDLLIGGRTEPPPPKKRRKQRSQFTEDQLGILRQAFRNCNKLNALTTMELINQTGLEKTKIQGWYVKQRKLESAGGVTGARNNATTQSQSPPEVAGSSKQETRTNSEQEARNVPAPYEKDNHALKTQRTEKSQTPEQIALKIESRVEKILTFSQSEILAALENRKARSSTLIRLFMEEKLDFKKKLLSETTRIKEKSMRYVFNDIQKSCMKNWRAKFIEQIKKNEAPDIAERLDSADSNILSVWVPLLVYGRILNVSLKETVRDFTFQSRHRLFSPKTEEYITPRFLQIYCRNSGDH